MRKEWRGFKGTKWTEEVNLRDFIQNNYTAYEGDETFLAEPTEATNILWGRLQELQKEERAKGGVLDMETEIVSSMTAYGPGYIDESKKDLEKVVGLQTDKPLKRAFMPFGGIKMAEQACTNYGYKPSEKLHEIFTKYCKTHNDGVFDAYTEEMKHVRHNHILTGLPRHLWSWPYRGRLSSCGPLRYRFHHCREGGRQAQLRCWCDERRRYPSA